MTIPPLLPFRSEAFEHGPLVSVGFPAEKRKQVGIRPGRAGGDGNDPRRVQRVADAGHVVGRAGFEVRIVPAGFERDLSPLPQPRKFGLGDFHRPLHSRRKRGGRQVRRTDVRGTESAVTSEEIRLGVKPRLGRIEADFDFGVRQTEQLLKSDRVRGSDIGCRGNAKFRGAVIAWRRTIREELREEGIDGRELDE